MTHDGSVGGGAPPTRAHAAARRGPPSLARQVAAARGGGGATPRYDGVMGCWQRRAVGARRCRRRCALDHC